MERFVQKTCPIIFLFLFSWIYILNKVNDFFHDLEYINIGNEDGLELEYAIDDNILWLSYFGLPPYELPIQGSFIMNIIFDQSIAGDVNQDGSCNIQDIILMINYILGNQNLSEAQINIADLNNNWINQNELYTKFYLLFCSQTKL